MHSYHQTNQITIKQINKQTETLFYNIDTAMYII